MEDYKLRDLRASHTLRVCTALTAVNFFFILIYYGTVRTFEKIIFTTVRNREKGSFPK